MKFVILAAGRGTRIGRAGAALHKALVPLGDRAVLSHLLDLAPPFAEVIICLGDRGHQIREYVALAHPNKHVTFVDVDGWDGVGGGPGHSLLAARSAVGDDEFVFTSCDTLWERDERLWKVDGSSWMGVAPVPAGTPPERWCRVAADGDGVIVIVDKEPGAAYARWAYVGLARICRDDAPAFWVGVEGGDLVGSERQVSGGLKALDGLEVRRVTWTDVGDAQAYHDAVARTSGYDWTKLDEATFVLPTEGRVVKYWQDGTVITRRLARIESLGEAVPALIARGANMLAYQYVPGVTGYVAAEETGTNMTRALLEWGRRTLWSRASVHPAHARTRAFSFYHDKTHARAAMLPPDLRDRVQDVVSRIDFDALVAGVEPGIVHGDFNLGNVLVRNGDGFIGIDWREDFAGETGWGDVRYDYAKLMAGMVVHWGRARYGDFRVWEDGRAHLDVVRHALPSSLSCKDVEVIGALSLLNSAPLHASPLDEVCVARGCAWLEEVL